MWLLQIVGCWLRNFNGAYYHGEKGEPDFSCFQEAGYLIVSASDSAFDKKELVKNAHAEIYKF